MRRRRRRAAREIDFSFDSFLDVVANVVGIIIRLILVVWVGARSYSTWQQWAPPPDTPAPVVASPLPDIPPDPLQGELARQRQELEQAQARLLEHLRDLQQLDGEQAALDRELAVVSAGRQGHAQTAAVSSPASVDDGPLREASLPVEELRRRCRQLGEEVLSLEKVSAPKQTLQARSPVSRPVKADELFFECQRGRVTFIDLQPMLDEVRGRLQTHTDTLRSNWEVRDAATPVGAFRLHYVVERERGGVDGPSAVPIATSGFRYGVGAWELEPLDPNRGEPVEWALTDGSEFRRIVDLIDPQMTTVTFWVYPDSFALYRRLRDYLADRDVVVAGRPLPDGVPIASSRRGTSSRGQ
jgi:hypothetical protein